MDIKIAACDVCGDLLSPSDKVLISVLPLLVQNVREKNTAVKMAAEMALHKLIHGNAHLKVQRAALLVAPLQ